MKAGRHLRILMLVPNPNIHGPLPKHTPLLVEALRQLGCSVRTEFWGRQREGETLAEKSIGRVRSIANVYRALRSETFDVMVVKTAHDWATLARDIPLVVACRRLSPRIVIQFAGSRSDRLVVPGSGFFKSATRLLVELSDAAMVLSSQEQQQWQRFAPAKPFYVVQNPFLPLEVPGVSDRHIGVVRRNEPVLLFVGRLIAAKGIFELLTAMPTILSQVQCHLLVAGDGDEAYQVRQCIQRLGLEGNVTMTGYITGGSLATIYDAASILVLPTFFDEGFPTVISEAMSAGLPIVTTRIRGAADHLEEGINALFVQPHDPDGLAESLIHLLNDAPLRQRMAQANREKVKEFAPERVAPLYLKVLTDVVQPTPKATSNIVGGN